MKKFFSLFLLLLISFKLITSWKCGADQLKLKPKGIDISKLSKKRRLASNYEPIKILADYSNLRLTSGISQDTIQKVMQLINEVCEEFSKILKVIPINMKLNLDENEVKQYCEVDNLGAGFENYFLFNDLVIFPYFDSTLASNVLAAAGMCMFLNEIYRPIFGILLINPNLSFNKKNTDLYA